MNCKLVRVAGVLGIVAMLSACSFDEGLRHVTDFNQKVSDNVSKYAPILGKNLLLVGNIIIQAECSPLSAAVGQTAQNLLTIMAATSVAADVASNVLATNRAITEQICPLVSAIKATVGQVPTGPITASIPAPKAARRGVSKDGDKILVIKEY